ncbi:MAG: hypothetical protein P1U68_04540 [Verrucomicrobiales bacterium]|nr:hypothetical protein [Verrucomicrobiales bacterium]
MDPIKNLDVSMAELYFGFFLVSFVILFAIFVSALPSLFKALVKAFHLIRARRIRQVRMLADLSSLECAADRLEGVTLFREANTGEGESQDEDDALTDAISGAA